MPTPFSQRTRLPSPRYGPTIPPLRPKTSFPQLPTYDRPTSTDNYPCTDTSPRRNPRIATHKIYPMRSSPVHGSQSPARHTASPPQPHTQGITHRAPGANFCFHKFTNPLGIDTIHGVHVFEQINYTSTPPQHTLRPRDFVQEGREREREISH